LGKKGEIASRNHLLAKLMKHLFTLLLMCMSTVLLAQISDIRINELDQDEPGTDTLEFVELYGAPNTALDGLVLVLINGATDASYEAYDLDGYSTDELGFFLLGTPGVPNTDLVITYTSPGTIQNGQDAIALYEGNASDWPTGTAVSAFNVIDALVYSSGDGPDDALSAALTPGQTYIDIAPNSPYSFSRLPDGGGAGDLGSYVIQSPTPGYTNVPACSGAQVIVQSGHIQQCTDSTNAPISFSTTGLYGDNYIYILTDTAELILEWNTTGLLDMDTYGVGTYQVYGFSYNGTLDEATAAAGSPLNSITASSCQSLSSNFIQVTREDCNLTGCNAGTVTLDNGLAYLSFCQINNPGTINFTHTEEGVIDQYRYFLTNSNNQIYQELIAGSYDLSTLGIGEYHIYGVSYFGNLLPETVQPTDLIFDVQSSGGCVAISENYIDIRNIDCFPADGCSRVIISEYIEGNGPNKAIELYNATPFPVDLDDYDLFSYTNGDTSFIVLDTPEGMLAPGETYVVCSAQADSALIALADNSTASMNNFNGNDAVVLTYNLEAIDIIGVIGDTVTEWAFGLASTLNQTLRRKFEVNAPTTNWELSAGQWLNFNNSDFSNLGIHAAQVCTQQPYLTFNQTGIQVNEDAGFANVVISAYNVLSATPVTVQIVQGSATAGVDFTTPFPVQFVFDPSNTTGVINLAIVDDDIEENFETITLFISDATGNAVYVNQYITITIQDNDQSYPLYPIATITSTNSMGTLDSLNTICSLRGIVHGANFNPGGLELTLIDATDGIRIFSANNNFGYTPAEGDQIEVQGQVNQFNGMAEFLLSSVQLISAGNALEVPQTVSVLGESNESHMVKLECITLVDTAQWGQFGTGFFAGGFDVDVTDGVNTNVMRIDFNCDMFSLPPLDGHFTAIGIGAQMDETSPFTIGYKFFPRYLLDISQQVVSSFTLPNPIDYDASGAEVAFANLSSSGTYNWDFGDGNTSAESSPTHAYTYEFLSGIAQLDVSLSTTIDGCTDTQTETVDVIYTLGVNEPKVSFDVFPNPAGDRLTIRSSARGKGWSVTDASGRMIFSSSKSFSGDLQLPLETLAPGSYFIQLEFESTTVSKRFIKF
jgi:Lamin Tail Domain/Calx-beta domain/Secretion system C-terminal sorting domain